MRKLFRSTAALCIAVLYSYSQSSHIILAPLFTDNLVLQQKSDAPIWGKGIPGTAISIAPSWGKKVKAIVQPDSTWMVKIKTPKAGGPYTLTIAVQESTIVLKNILIGEVWLCSGQSNMEMPLEGWPPENPIDNSATEIQQAVFPNIRLFVVDHAISLEPNEQCVGSWKECTPEVAAKFSATAFFFGKKLHRDLKVPIGLIQSAWGGTHVQAWTSGKFLTQDSAYTNLPEQLQQAEKEFTTYMTWLTSHTVVDISNRDAMDRCKGLDFGDSLCARKDYNDSGWQEISLPRNWEDSNIGIFDGVVWFRKKIEIPKSWLNKNLTLQLGPIDDYDITFVNGYRVSGMETGSPWNVKRMYSVPADIVRDSILTIAIRVIDNLGGGGFWGRKEEFNIRASDDSTMISLAGSWKILPIAEYRDLKFYLFGIAEQDFYKRPPLTMELSSQTPSSLYNGMIAPLIPFSIKGAIWYQGESNTENPEAYKTLFPLMIKNWRNDWHNEFSFYFAQIAPFNYGEERQSQRLREAQLQTLSLQKTGMAVTLDIGNATNIHPSNKTEVGERLARWALAKEYCKKIPYSGPIYKSMKIRNSTAILSFDHADGLIVKKKDAKASFQIAGEDSVFKEAEVTVQGKTLLVYSPEIKRPIAVRYAWSNVPEATLFNKAGLPASSFRTDNWEK